MTKDMRAAHAAYTRASLDIRRPDWAMRLAARKARELEELAAEIASGEVRL